MVCITTLAWVLFLFADPSFNLLGYDDSIPGALPNPESERAIPPEELQRVITDGNILVRQIFCFYERTGLWPCSLEELDPLKTGSDEHTPWSYSWTPEDGWWLYVRPSFPQKIQFSNTGEHPFEWRLAGAWRSDLIVLSHTPTCFPPPTTETTHAEKEATIQRRIRSQPRVIAHCQALITLLYHQQNYEQALIELERVERRWPADYWWTRVMYALLMTKAGKKTEAEIDLLRWWNRHHDFTRGYYVAFFYSHIGEPEQALCIVESMLELEINTYILDAALDDTLEE